MAHRRDEPPMSGSEPPQLLIIRPSNLFRAHQDGFSAKFNVLKAYESPLPTETFLREHAQSAKAILCFKGSPITGDLLRHLPSLGLVVTSGTGVNHIDLAACRRRGILVANTADVFSVDTADYAVGLLIAVMRKISGGDRYFILGTNRSFTLLASIRIKSISVLQGLQLFVVIIQIPHLYIEYELPCRKDTILSYGIPPILTQLAFIWHIFNWLETCADNVLRVERKVEEKIIA
uniref:Putative hydroxyphenylpyruvate reductase 4 n=1 Tax=Salvia miltiorrhiza TaxID=226208 RepID=U3NDK7_SALMI|nr:putative hydroxyphenylpyruvate reductase 4 [Salvia miltiorrhiza]